MFVFLPKYLALLLQICSFSAKRIMPTHIISKFFERFVFVFAAVAKKVSDLAVADMTTQWRPICLVELESLPRLLTAELALTLQLDIFCKINLFYSNGRSSE